MDGVALARYGTDLLSENMGWGGGWGGANDKRCTCHAIAFYGTDLLSENLVWGGGGGGVSEYIDMYPYRQKHIRDSADWFLTRT